MFTCAVNPVKVHVINSSIPLLLLSTYLRFCSVISTDLHSNVCKCSRIESGIETYVRGSLEGSESPGAKGQSGCIANSQNNHAIRTEGNLTPNQILTINGYPTGNVTAGDGFISSRQLFPDDIMPADYVKIMNMAHYEKHL